MAHIDRRSRTRADGATVVRWRVRYRVVDDAGRQVERSKTFDRADDAKRFRRRVEGEVDTGTYLDPRRARDTLAAFVPEWRASVVDLRPSALARLDATVDNHVVPAWGEVPLAAITNASVRAWVAELGASGLSTSSIRKAALALRRILAAAVADRRLAVNPADDVPLPGETHGDQRFLSAEQVADLVEAMRGLHPRCHGPDATGERYAALVMLAAWGGLRWGECAGLRRRRVDLLARRVEVAETLSDVDGKLAFGPPKSKRSARTVPLPRVAVDALADHLDRFVAPNGDALVFTTAAGEPLHRSPWRGSWWLPAVRAAGLDGLRFHDLRHTYVSLCAAAGLDMVEVSKRAGHSSMSFTADRYAHLFDDAGDEYADALDAVADQGGRPAGRAAVAPLMRPHASQNRA
jgi:integrase